MELRNFSPFPPLAFQSRDVERHDFGVIVLRGTFDLIPGQRLRPSVNQKPLLLVDEYAGEPGQSSLLFENNLAPYKPRADLHVRANAIAPGGVPAEHWDVKAQVGTTHTAFTVTGPRKWKKGLVGWRLETPQLTAEMPVVFENAFGGQHSAANGSSSYSRNPIGKGWMPSPVGNGLVEIDAPTLLPLGKVDLALGEELPVVGLLPVPPNWKQRSELAGSFNLMWEKTRWPDLPADFLFDFYNSSMCPGPKNTFFRGDEAMEFINLHSVSPFRADLPRISLHGLVRCADGQIIPTPINLDTVSVDLITDQVFLVWRGVFPVDKVIRVFEVRIDVPDELRA